ncbi:MAG TPA: hypothetical protein VHD38_00020 [Candidatus Paceibacterota bacterium]|nr:hypothetical protein [Candidatus Paceibacterota bacterium]
MGDVFRCPFEVKGREDGSIIEHELPDVQEKRFALLREVFERFHRGPRFSAVRLVLPDSVWTGCTSNAGLKPVILPYQAEIIAADLDDQCFPFLPHQDEARTALEGLGLTLPFDKKPAQALRKKFGRHEPKTIAQLSALLQQLFEKNDGTVIEVREPRWFGKGKLLMHFDRSSLFIDGEVAKSTFEIVKTPFYPKEFGRYSERVEIVLTRHLDVARLSDEVRRRIRRQANEVHAKHGAPIADLDVQQPAGLWLPDEFYTSLPLG